MWLARDELKQLEDEAFHLDEHAKGTLVFSAKATTAPCPQCQAAMKAFSYRLYDLELEYCEAGHGFWLDAGEDDRVLELIKKEEAGIDRSFNAEHKWVSTVKHLHSGSFMSKMRDLFR
jgi:Zn-finger nucleic acid-binding protein